MPVSRQVAVIGAGWAGLAAAVRATERGHSVTLLEMARQAGGRARGLSTRAGEFDNGQHILIGAYTRTLALMSTVGADPDRLLRRLPLDLRYPDGRGLRLPTGRPLLAFARGVLTAHGWTVGERLRLLQTAAGWAARGFRCHEAATVATLCRRLPAAVLRDLVEPLCVAALNTPMSEASAQVFLRVLQDALFSGRGGADLLLPSHSLSELLPRPALSWLASRGATLCTGARVMNITKAAAGGWTVDGRAFDAVVLACTAQEAARLAAPIDPGWSQQAARLRYEPIITAYLAASGEPRLPAPMLALDPGPDAPAQFAFDLGALGRPAGTIALVASGAAPWVERGLDVTARAMLGQARRHFPRSFAAPDDRVLLHAAAEQRATFACTPGLKRPPSFIAERLLAAADYVAGPYPATLEGAVRSAEAAVAALEQR
jgi:squalene-associated FAD-dependent desaturase